MAWSEDEVALLRVLWTQGLSQTDIRESLGARFGHLYTRQTIARKAIEIHLGTRRFQVMGDEAARIAELRKAGKTNLEIAAVMGLDIEAVHYRVRTMIACGLLDTRADPFYYAQRWNRPDRTRVVVSLR